MCVYPSILIVTTTSFTVPKSIVLVRTTMMRGTALFHTLTTASLLVATTRGLAWRSTGMSRQRLSSSLSAATGTASSSASSTTSTVIQNMLYRIRQVNSLPNDLEMLDFCLDGVVLGKVRPDKAATLRAATFFDQQTVFCLDPQRPRTLTLSNTIAPTCQARTAAVRTVMEQLRDAGRIRGWRDEDYPVAAKFGDAPLLLVERAAVPWLGALEYGVHMNGMLSVSDTAAKDDTTVPRLWMARRSATKSKYPGMVDHLVAGGQPAGLSLWENAVKECQEEAGIPADVARQALQPVGAVSYASLTADDTLTRAVLFTYDLHVPANFTPTPVDGEVEEFFPWSVDDMLASLAPDYPDPLKPNCYLVLIDWLIRHGHVSPDTPGYLEVLRELRSGDCQ